MIEALWSWLSAWFVELNANFNLFPDLFDIAIVAFVIYWLLLMIRGTRAVQILVGLLILIGMKVLSRTFSLDAVDFILSQFLYSAVLIVIVLFQPDIRRALARVGRGVFRGIAGQEEHQMLEEVVRATQILAQKRVGALIVMERETSLSDLIEAGVTIDAEVSHELLVAFFLPYSPLHDGAVVIQAGRVAQAGCILPLTMRDGLPEGLGTRHRAAVGITEETDAVVIVVSEETSSLSVVYSGELVSDLDGPRLREALRDILSLPPGAPLSLSPSLLERVEVPDGAPALAGDNAVLKP